MNQKMDLKMEEMQNIPECIRNYIYNYLLEDDSIGIIAGIEYMCLRNMYGKNRVNIQKWIDYVINMYMIYFQYNRKLPCILKESIICMILQKLLPKNIPINKLPFTLFYRANLPTWAENIYGKNKLGYLLNEYYRVNEDNELVKVEIIYLCWNMQLICLKDELYMKNIEWNHLLTTNNGIIWTKISATTTMIEDIRYVLTTLYSSIHQTNVKTMFVYCTMDEMKSTINWSKELLNGKRELIITETFPSNYIIDSSFQKPSFVHDVCFLGLHEKHFIHNDWINGDWPCRRLTISNNVQLQHISSNFIVNNHTLEEIYLPNSSTYFFNTNILPKNMFQYCNNLCKIYGNISNKGFRLSPNSFQYLQSKILHLENIIDLPESCIQYNPLLTKIYFCDIKNIQQHSIQFNHSLQTIIIQDCNIVFTDYLDMQKDYIITFHEHVGSNNLQFKHLDIQQMDSQPRSLSFDKSCFSNNNLFNLYKFLENYKTNF